jgi:hypothetical protein
MVATWRRHGGLTGDPQRTHLPPARVFAHLGLAVAGLVVWIVFLATDAVVWAWIALADLVLVAVLGGLLVRRWTVDGRLAMSGAASVSDDLAEQHISRLPVVLHGIFAVSTLVLVILTVVGVGEV